MYLQQQESIGGIDLNQTTVDVFIMKECLSVQHCGFLIFIVWRCMTEELAASQKYFDQFTVGFHVFSWALFNGKKHMEYHQLSFHWDMSLYPHVDEKSSSSLKPQMNPSPIVPFLQLIEQF